MTTRTRTPLDATDTDVEAFRAHVGEQEVDKVTLKVRRKYICVDVGTSGKFMVDRGTGEIWGIKGYGRPHRAYSYGTVETPEHWPTAHQYTTGQPIPLSKVTTKPAPTVDPFADARAVEGDGTTYPELHEAAARIADTTCFDINRTVRDIESAMPYKAQFVLEEAIKILQGRV